MAAAEIGAPDAVRLPSRRLWSLSSEEGEVKAVPPLSVPGCPCRLLDVCAAQDKQVSPPHFKSAPVAGPELGLDG